MTCQDEVIRIGKKLEKMISSKNVVSFLYLLVVEKVVCLNTAYHRTSLINIDYARRHVSSYIIYRRPSLHADMCHDSRE